MLSNKQIVKKLFSDLDSYKEFIEESLEKHLEEHPDKKIYWSAWFEGAEGKDLENADRGIVFNKPVKNLVV